MIYAPFSVSLNKIPAMRAGIEVVNQLKLTD